jgi:hypothetical protein
MENEISKGATSRGEVSFSIPRAAVEALLESQATAYEICTYLVLARFTDRSGQYSSAGVTAVNRYTGANKVNGGPVDRAIKRLCSIRAKRPEAGVAAATRGADVPSTDLGPILYSRDDWRDETGEVLPDGPTERGKILHVLPDLDEPIEERIWIGGNLVTGYGAFKRPLKTLKDAGDVAARLLLAMYESNDMERWTGVCPAGVGMAIYKRYAPVSGPHSLGGRGKLMRAKDSGPVGGGVFFRRVWQGPVKGDFWENHEAAGDPVWRALEALDASGLVYEIVMVLNREGVESTSGSGASYDDIPLDAEPLYELDCRSLHGYKPKGEEGVGGATANTAGALGHSVAMPGGELNGTYAGLVRAGQGAMIVGLYRMRFRVSNPQNAGVSGVWRGIHDRNSEALRFINQIRVLNGLAPYESPVTKRPIAKIEAGLPSTAAAQ